MSELRDARLGRAKLPPGYRVVWSDSVEHYFWLCETSDRESVLTWDKWASISRSMDGLSRPHAAPSARGRMSKRPPTMEEAGRRGLIVDEKSGIYTFSNGTDWECWATSNCLSCRWYDDECAGGECAFEGAALLHGVSPELAAMFGWVQTETKYGPQSGWDKPWPCSFFKDRDDDSPDPPIIDPTQLTFLAPDGFPDVVPEPVFAHA